MSFQNNPLRFCHFFLQSRRQNRQTHDFNQTDIFFFDVMQILRRMKNPPRVFLIGPVIPKYEVDFIFPVPHSRYRGNRVVWYRLTTLVFDAAAVNPGIRIGVGSPFLEDMVRCLFHLLPVRALQSNYRHRPFDNPRFYLRKSRKFKNRFIVRSRHRECIIPALEVIVA